jgi:hypothetical protein
MQASLGKVEGHSTDIICAQDPETPVLLDSLEQRVVVEIGVVRAVDHYIHGAERNQRRIHLVAGSARVFVEGDDHQCAATDGVPGEGAAHGPFTSANGTAVLTEFLDFMDGNNELQEISLHYHAVPHRIL